jgi:hypothetical protein
VDRIELVVARRVREVRLLIQQRGTAGKDLRSGRARGSRRAGRIAASSGVRWDPRTGAGGTYLHEGRVRELLNRVAVAVETSLFFSSLGSRCLAWLARLNQVVCMQVYMGKNLYSF